MKLRSVKKKFVCMVPLFKFTLLRDLLSWRCITLERRKKLWSYSANIHHVCLKATHRHALFAIQNIIVNKFSIWTCMFYFSANIKSIGFTNKSLMRSVVCIESHFFRDFFVRLQHYVIYWKINRTFWIKTEVRNLHNLSQRFTYEVLSKSYLISDWYMIITIDVIMSLSSSGKSHCLFHSSIFYQSFQSQIFLLNSSKFLKFLLPFFFGLKEDF